MKRNYTTHSTGATSKSNMWDFDSNQTPPDAGDDELLAMLGYKVRSSDMNQVVQKLEQLEQAMSKTNHNNNLSQTSHVHFNPSDISSWLESMITEFNPHNNNSLDAIPGQAIYPPKKLKISEPEPTQPVVLLDSQENGVRLVHSLLACAEAVQQNNLKLAEALVKQIGFLAVSQPGAMKKVATYFAEGLARRIYGLYPQNVEFPFSDTLQMHFYETCPYIKFAHFTANQAILEAFDGKERVHVIDFGMKQGNQWPALIQALAVRDNGPPSCFRLTGIGPVSNDGSDYLQEVGWKLAQFADSMNVKFEYRGFVANSLMDIESSMLDLREGEVVAVNSVFELHQLLAKPNGIEKVLSSVRKMKPEIVTVVEQESDHNGPVFLDRFTESLHYFSTIFDSLESCNSGEDKVMSEVYLGRQICNVVACEGVDRVERHEKVEKWRKRFELAGFGPVHLGSNAHKQVSLLLELFGGGEGYRVEERDGCLMLGWHTRPLVTTSAWKLK